MSMVLSFTRVTTEELDRAIADPEWASGKLSDEDLPYVDLDKAWAGIQFLLDAAEVDVELYEDGDLIDEDCTLLGWDRELVAKAARELGAAPFAALAAHYDAAAMTEQDVYPRVWNDNSLDYLSHFYEQLVEFFAATAANGGAAIRTFSF